MSNVVMMRGGEAGVRPEGDEAAVIATEFLLNHPVAFLRLGTASAVCAVLLVGGLDWLAVFHLMELKFTDAMGQPVGSMAGLVAMSGVTLIAYVLIGYAWARPQRWAKAAALLLYAVVLGLLALAIAPVEGSAIRDVWASLSGGGGFGAEGGAQDAPAWFVLPCLAVLTVAFSLFGLVFLAAKDWLWNLLGLWRYRARALATLQRIDAAQRQADERRQRADLIAALETPAVADTLVQAVLRQGLTAYRAALTAQIEAGQTALADLRMTKAQRQRVTTRLDAAAACLRSANHFDEEAS